MTDWDNPTRRRTSQERREALKTAAAKQLRSQLTPQERKLWHALRAKRFAAVRFRRQQPIGPYVADFYCSLAKLVIELDGSQHRDAEAIVYDVARTTWLEHRGYRVLRFTNWDVDRNLEGVMEGIWLALQACGRPLPEPPPRFDPPSRGG